MALSTESFYKAFEANFVDSKKTAFVLTPGLALNFADYEISESNSLGGYRTSVLVDKAVDTSITLSSKGSKISQLYEELVYYGKAPNPDQTMYRKYMYARGKLNDDYDNQIDSALYTKYKTKRKAYTLKQEVLEAAMRLEHRNRWKGYYDEALPKTTEALEFQDIQPLVEPLLADIEEYQFGESYGGVKIARKAFEEQQRTVYDTDHNQYNYHNIEMTPSNWYTYMDPSMKDDSAWLKITVQDNATYPDSLYEEFSGTAHDRTGVLPLISARESGSSGYSTVVSIEKDSHPEISFLARAVEITFPWLNLGLLGHDLTLSGIPPGGWSTGELSGNNNGSFPMYPTRLILVKNVTVKARQFNRAVLDIATHKNTSVSSGLLFNIFSFGSSGSASSSSEEHNLYYNEKNSTIEIKGVQVAGICCGVVPHFPKSSN